MDDDNNGIPDADEIAEEDGDNLEEWEKTPGDPNLIDTDGDGVPDVKDRDDDNDGILDEHDPDDNNNGIPDEDDWIGKPRVWSFGFGYRASWASFILIFTAVVLLICDRESKEIFYMEEDFDEEEEEEEVSHNCTCIFGGDCF